MVAKGSGRACNSKSSGNFRLPEQDGTKSNLLGRKKGEGELLAPSTPPGRSGNG